MKRDHNCGGDAGEDVGAWAENCSRKRRLQATKIHH